MMDALQQARAAHGIAVFKLTSATNERLAIEEQLNEARAAEQLAKTAAEDAARALWIEETRAAYPIRGGEVETLRKAASWGPSVDSRRLTRLESRTESGGLRLVHRVFTRGQTSTEVGTEKETIRANKYHEIEQWKKKFGLAR
jgi:hypothetical protein